MINIMDIIGLIVTGLIALPFLVIDIIGICRFIKLKRGN